MIPWLLKLVPWALKLMPWLSKIRPWLTQARALAVAYWPVLALVAALFVFYAGMQFAGSRHERALTDLRLKYAEAQRESEEKAQAQADKLRAQSRKIEADLHREITLLRESNRQRDREIAVAVLTKKPAPLPGGGCPPALDVAEFGRLFNQLGNSPGR